MQYNEQMPNMVQMPAPPAPEKKRNVGLILAIIAVAVAIVGVSVFGVFFIRKLNNDKKCEQVIQAIETDRIDAAIAICREGNAAFVRNYMPQIAVALADQVEDEPYEMDRDKGFVNDEDVQRYLDYRTLAQIVGLSAYAPETMDYIDTVCELEAFMEYDPVLCVFYETNEDMIQGLNYGSQGFEYMADSYMFLGASYMDDGVEYIERTLDAMEDYDMSATYVREYYDAVTGICDGMKNIATYARSGNLSAMVDELEDYGVYLETANTITETAGDIADELLEVSDRITAAEEKL